MKFLPAANSTTAGSFDVEASQNGSTVAVQSGKATSTINVTPVGDTPPVANITTDEDTLTGAIVINRNADDGAEVTHFRISGITGGTLFKSNGITPINNGDFLLFAEVQSGVRFLPTANSNVAGHFDVESSQDGSTVAAQSGKATSTITVTDADQQRQLHHSR
ncbi:MAG: autotransporter adhesin [Planctomycetota bacterium]|nr:MAG: autotransporter adhesin [Planctomycetota bacterium]